MDYSDNPRASRATMCDGSQHWIWYWQCDSVAEALEVAFELHREGAEIVVTRAPDGNFYEVDDLNTIRESRMLPIN